MAQDNLITVEELREYLGADERADINAIRNSVIDELRRSTGVDWRENTETGTANEALRVISYLNYYGVRGGANNLDYLQQRKTQLVKMLQTASEVGGDA